MNSAGEYIKGIFFFSKTHPALAHRGSSVKARHFFMFIKEFLKSYGGMKLRGAAQKGCF